MSEAEISKLLQRLQQMKMDSSSSVGDDTMKSLLGKIDGLMATGEAKKKERDLLIKVREQKRSSIAGMMHGNRLLALCIM